MPPTSSLPARPRVSTSCRGRSCLVRQPASVAGRSEGCCASARLCMFASRVLWQAGRCQHASFKLLSHLPLATTRRRGRARQGQGGLPVPPAQRAVLPRVGERASTGRACRGQKAGPCPAHRRRARCLGRPLCLCKLRSWAQACPCPSRAPPARALLPQPALFIPHASIRSVELMRAGGASSTFDLVVHLRSGRQHEFGFIAREEVAGIEGGRGGGPAAFVLFVFLPAAALALSLCPLLCSCPASSLTSRSPALPPRPPARLHPKVPPGDGRGRELRGGGRGGGGGRQPGRGGRRGGGL